MSKFRINITKHEVVGKRQMWMKTADSGNNKDNGAVYEYVDTNEDETSEKGILSMEVEEINLQRIITAIIGSRKRKSKA